MTWREGFHTIITFQVKPRVCCWDMQASGYCRVPIWNPHLYNYHARRFCVETFTCRRNKSLGEYQLHVSCKVHKNMEWNEVCMYAHYSSSVPIDIILTLHGCTYSTEYMVFQCKLDIKFCHQRSNPRQLHNSKSTTYRCSYCIPGFMFILVIIVKCTIWPFCAATLEY